MTHHNPPNLLEQATSYLAYPLQKPLEMGFQWGADIVSDTHDLFRAHSENQVLRKKVLELIESRNIYYELAFTNKRLRRMLEFKEANDYPLYPAQVIGHDAQSWYQTIVIDKGQADGIEANMPLVTYGGLVGRIIEATNYMSRVQLLHDQASRVGVMVQRTRSVGILKGTGQRICDITYLERSDDVMVGDRIITSGLGGVFPKGLFVGEVTSVTLPDTSLFAEVKVELTVDIFKLEELFVLQKNYSSKIQELLK